MILQANGRKTASPADVAAVVADARRAGRDSVLLMVNHSGRRVFVPVQIDHGAG